MKQLRLVITAHAPLAIGRQRPGGSVSEVEHYIPGSVVRGALAVHILSLASADAIEPGDDFDQLFTGDTPAIFQNAYPAVAQINENLLQVIDHPVWVVPATAVSSKTNPGFTTTGGSGVFDTLIDRFCAQQVGYPYEPTLPSDEGQEDLVEPFSGFYSQRDKQYFQHNVNTRFLTRVGINRRRAVAEDQILYSVEVLNESFLVNTRTTSPEWEPVRFQGCIGVSTNELAERLEQFINQEPLTLRLGGSGSRGLGKVTITASEESEGISLADRLVHFNQFLHQRWKLWSILRTDQTENTKDIEGRTFFTLDLQSDAILTEQWRRTTVVSADMLRELADAPPDESLKLHTAYSNYGYRSGWNAAWGLMKDQELVTQRGGVYLFSTTQPDAWEQVLVQLEQRGIGDRTSEGFGQVRVCSEFHQVMRENPA
jgi:CRISPR-associated protein Csx10